MMAVKASVPLLLFKASLAALVCPPDNLPDPVNPVVDCLGNIVQPGHTLVVEEVFTNLKQGINQILPEPKPSQNGIAYEDDILYITTGLYNVGDRVSEVYKCTISSKTCTLWFSLDDNLPSPRAVNYLKWQHGGLRGIAFHSDFQQNGIFYTSQMEDRAPLDTGIAFLSDAEKPKSVVSMVSEWKYDFNGNFVLQRDLIKIGMPVYDHPIKQIAWRDGYLYITHGDGSVQSAVAGGGQNMNDALGKILRIKPEYDIDGNPTTASDGKPYSTDNPIFEGGDSLPEIYAAGFRNPHHLAFDSEGNLFAASSGRDNVEEVNWIKAGKNYGWSSRDGTFIHLQVPNGLWTGIAPLASSESEHFEYPVAQWGHTGAKGDTFSNHSGKAGGGGFPIENGSPLEGKYHYFDFPTRGKVWYSSLADMKAAVTSSRSNLTKLSQATSYRAGIYDKIQDLFANNLHDIFDVRGRLDVRFGYGPQGEIYISSKKAGSVLLVSNSKPEYIEKKYYELQSTCIVESEHILGTEIIRADKDGTAGKDGTPSLVSACRAMCQHKEKCVGFAYDDSQICTFFHRASCNSQQATQRTTSHQCIVPEYVVRDGDCDSALEISRSTVGSLQECEGLCACDDNCRGFSFNPSTSECIKRSFSCLSTTSNDYTFYEKPGSRFVEKPIDETMGPGINSVHNFGSKGRSCTTIQIPSGFCRACTFRRDSFYGINEMPEISSRLLNDGNGTTCDEHYPVLVDDYALPGPFGYFPNADNIFNMISADCLEKLKEYVQLNPCDTARRNFLEDILNFAVKDLNDIVETDVQAYYSAIESWDYVAYAMCESCCDCIDFGSDKYANDVNNAYVLERGNCYAHPKYDICRIYPNIKLVGAPGEVAEPDAPYMCPILDNFKYEEDSPKRYPTTRFNFDAYPEIPPFLNRLIDALQCSDPRIYGKCFNLECSQGRIRSIDQNSPTVSPPSFAPSMSPSVILSSSPTAGPSDFPLTEAPTSSPTSPPSTIVSTEAPTESLSSSSPTNSPSLVVSTEAPTESLSTSGPTNSPSILSVSTEAPTAASPGTSAPQTPGEKLPNPGDYFEVPGRDCDQGDLPSAKRSNMTVRTCEDECSQLQECVGFSFKLIKTDCYLKGTANCGTLRKRNGFTYYAQFPAYLEMDGDCTNPDINVLSSNLLAIPEDATLVECAGYCAAESQCAGFSYGSMASPTCIARSASCSVTNNDGAGGYTFYQK